MNRKDENRFKNQNRECDIVSQVIRLTILDIVRASKMQDESSR